MSRRNQPPPDDQLVLAAELRIANKTWDAVAEKLHRSAETVRRWPLNYPDRWRTALHHAERRLAVDSEAEAVIVLRALLRDTDSKIRWQAARSLVALRIELGKLDVRILTHARPGESLDKAKLAVELLEGLTDDQLAELVSAEYERAAHLPAVAARPAPASAA